MHGSRDSNSRHLVLETSALPTELDPYKSLPYTPKIGVEWKAFICNSLFSLQRLRVSQLAQ